MRVQITHEKSFTEALKQESSFRIIHIAKTSSGQATVVVSNFSTKSGVVTLGLRIVLLTRAMNAPVCKANE